MLAVYLISIIADAVHAHSQMVLFIVRPHILQIYMVIFVKRC